MTPSQIRRLSVWTLGVLVLCASVGSGQEEKPQTEAQALNAASIHLQERKAKAQNYFDTGYFLYTKQKFQEAEDFFEKAVNANPSHEQAREYLVRVRSVLGVRREQVAEQSTWVQRQKQVQDQELIVQIEALLRKAKDASIAALSDKNLDLVTRSIRLEDNSEEFGKVIDLSKRLYDRARSEAYARMAREYLLKIDEMRTRINSSLAMQQRQKANSLQQSEIEESEKYLENRTRKLFDSIHLNIEKENFKDAIKLSEDILVIDPKNEQATELKSKAETLRHQKQNLETMERMELEKTRRFLQIKDSFIPYSSGVVYPEDWNMIKLRHKKSFEKQEEPEWKIKMERRMDQIQTYRSPGLRIDEILAQLSDITGLNILLDPTILQGASDESLFLTRFHFENMPLRFILKWVTKQLNLEYVLKDDIILVTRPEEITDLLIIEIYDVQDLISQRTNFTAPQLSVGNRFSAGSADGFDPFADAGGGEAAEEGLQLDTLIQLIRGVSGKWDDEESGVRLRSIEGSGQILIKNTAEVHNEVIDLLEMLRRSSALQVEVETRLLSIEKNFLKEIGLDWKGLSSSDQMGLAPDSQPGLLSNRSDLSSFDLRASVLNDYPWESSTTGLGFFLEHSILSKFQAKVLLRALETHTSVTQLIAPRIVMLNNVNAYIRLISTENFISSYSSGDSGVQPDIDSVDAGQLLVVRPTISSDRKYITLKIQPDFQRATIDRTVEIQGSRNVAQAGGGTAVANYTLPVELPKVIRQRIRTTAVIPDDGVLLLAGVAESDEEYGVRGVPILSKIPFLGRLFKSDSQSDSSVDAMYLVKGRILIFEEIEAEL
ncbi:MAG: hypothetical protein HQL31_01710 [Planctomycetes bacterium]|nr:hypothetical protein [Planctomycetota bacterium]